MKFARVLFPVETAPVMSPNDDLADFAVFDHLLGQRTKVFYTNSIGAPVLTTIWRDPRFKAWSSPIGYTPHHSDPR